MIKQCLTNLLGQGTGVCLGCVQHSRAGHLKRVRDSIFLIEVYLVYNITLVSGVQCREATFCIDYIQLKVITK